MNELSERDLMELKAKLDYEKHALAQGRVNNTAALPELLGRALEYTEHARELEKRFNQTRDEFEKQTAIATEAWNEFYRAIANYLETSASPAIKHSEITRMVENKTPVSVAGYDNTVYRGDTR